MRFKCILGTAGSSSSFSSSSILPEDNELLDFLYSMGSSKAEISNLEMGGSYFLIPSIPEFNLFMNDIFAVLVDCESSRVESSLSLIFLEGVSLSGVDLRPLII